MSAVHLKNHSLESMKDLLVSWGQPKFRAAQVFQWIWRRRADSVADMTNLPKSLRALLEERTVMDQLSVDSEQKALDGTRKMLVALPDGERVESVLIPDEKRRTLCVSTQVGCAMGCRFCRTATMGLKRHLEPWEIVEQIALAERLLTEVGDHREISGGRSQRSKVARRLTNLVFMGMGEPLHNIEGTITAIKILTEPEGLDFPARRITVSTVGLIDQAERLMNETDVRLAFSLNAPDDERRTQIMPVNNKFAIEDIIAFVKGLQLRRKERVTFEYVVLKGINDRQGDEEILIRHLRSVGERVKINLIPFNPFGESEFQRPNKERVEAFRDRLRDRGIHAFIRRPRGDDILAACGQLAHLKNQSGATPV